MTVNNNISVNRKANFEYDLIEKYEAGIVLRGSEVKSIRESKVNIKESYIKLKDRELFVIGMNISEYSHQGYSTHNPMREKKLLLNRKEINTIKKEIDEKGRTMIPLEIYILKKVL